MNASTLWALGSKIGLSKQSEGFCLSITLQSFDFLDETCKSSTVEVSSTSMMGHTSINAAWKSLRCLWAGQLGEHVRYNFLNEVSCVLNDEAPFTSFHFREFVLKNSVAPPRATLGSKIGLSKQSDDFCLSITLQSFDFLDETCKSSTVEVSSTSMMGHTSINAAWKSLRCLWAGQLGEHVRYIYIYVYTYVIFIWHYGILWCYLVCICIYIFCFYTHIFIYIHNNTYI